MIKCFTGEYFFLSNFYPSHFIYNGEEWTTAEHAYQCQKTIIPLEVRKIKSASSPGLAKAIGRTVTLRESWDKVKLSVMEEIVSQKFSQNEDLKLKLIYTGNKALLEGNWWYDYYWGVNIYSLYGQNHLGKILMKVREELIK